MKRKHLVVAVLSLALAAVAVLPALALAEGATSTSVPSEGAEAAQETGPSLEASPLDETCNSGHVCVWVEFHYNGAKGESLCTGGVHTLTGIKGSAKNRCANKASWLRLNGISDGCVNPENNYPEDSSGFNELWIGAEGSRC